ncbi:HEAT repeat domain-containing protein [Nocardiopsis terrae]
MAMFVHLTPRANITRVRRSGLRTTTGFGDARGVFCFPVLPSYTVTHQWLRELSRHHGPRGLVGVYVRLPDGETVTVGHHDDRRGPRKVTAAEAVRVIAALEDPRGWEVVVPRPVARSEVHRIREVRQVTGWRCFSDSHGAAPCTCADCAVRGGYDVRRLRQRRPHPLDGPVPPPRVLVGRISEARTRGDAAALREALGWFSRRRRGPVEELAPLADHPHPLVRASLAEAVAAWSTPGVDALLTRLAADPDLQVREEAVTALATRTDRRPPLARTLSGQPHER